MDWPSLLFLGAALAGLLLLLYLAWGGNRNQAARRRLDDFKTAVVAFSDRLDQLQERHRLLPYLDPDYTAPMTGETAHAYQAVQESLDQFRDRWLAMMDHWDQLQRQLDAGELQALSEEELNQRFEALQTTAATRQLQLQCDEALNALENAHEKAREAARGVEATRESARRALQEAGEMASPQLAQEEQAVEELVGVAQSQLEADPLGAMQTLQDAAGLADRWLARTQASAAAAKQLAEAHQRRRGLEQLLQTQQDAGFSFAEPEGDPRPLLEEAAGRLQQAELELRAGNPELAGPLLEAADAAVQRGDHAVRFQIRMRDFCQGELRRLQSLAEATRVDIDAARSKLEELRRGFAADSWALTADAPDRAEHLLQGMQQLFQRVDEAVRPDRQFYFRANRLLEEAARIAAEAGRLANAVPARLRELHQLRDACRERLKELQQTADQLARRLGGSSADRPRSNHRFQSAQRTLTELAADAADASPDWPGWKSRAEHLAHDLRFIDQMINEDLQLFAQADREIGESRRLLRETARYYRFGVRPNLRRAEQLLAEAERLRGNQQYEEAIAAANHAEQAALAAEETARRESLARQQDHHRRQRVETANQIGAILEVAAGAAMRALLHRRRRW